MSVFEYSFFLLVGFIPIYNLVCVILNNNQNNFEKLNIKINMLIYSSEQLKTKIENITNKTKIDEIKETPIDTPSSVVKESYSPIDTSHEDESDIDFVQDRVRNDKSSQNLSYFISSKLSNISSNFF